MLDFYKLVPSQKGEYEALLFSGESRGCEYSFANRCLWGKQLASFQGDKLAFFSHFQGKSLYSYPIGPGDKRQLIEALLEDARQRGIPFRMSGLLEAEAQAMESWFPEKFYIQPDRDSFDYVYDINDLADLKGRTYQKKRNHINRFRSEHPDYRVEPVTACNLPQVQHMVNDWFVSRKLTDPQGDYLLESIALAKAFQHLQCLELEALALFDGDRVLAVSIASRLSGDTFDVHFEKAREDADGAYPVINQEMARYLREKYPQLRYLNREEDMGLEGLRKAKLSYSPHHMVEKYRLCCRRDLHED